MISVPAQAMRAHPMLDGLFWKTAGCRFAQWGQSPLARSLRCQVSLGLHFCIGRRGDDTFGTTRASSASVPCARRSSPRGAPATPRRCTPSRTPSRRASRRSARSPRRRRPARRRQGSHMALRCRGRTSGALVAGHCRAPTFGCWSRKTTCGGSPTRGPCPRCGAWGRRQPTGAQSRAQLGAAAHAARSWTCCARAAPPGRSRRAHWRTWRSS
mmetsp:Transcript_37840/g.117998  ORF Transcript_37840/g.117998 Transcript_37840/m.117998 type:complete len:213 (-) Transcript_37840:355-993(-)